MKKDYTVINSQVIDTWVDQGWQWGTPIGHDVFLRVKEGDWSVLLTPTKPVPSSWFPLLKGKKVLGLASGGGQQMPIFSALGAHCTVLDFSLRQLDREAQVAQREGYSIELIQADMTKPLPFEEECFDLIFHPVSNCYIEKVEPLWKECYRILKKGGLLLSGLDNGLNYVFGEEEDSFLYSLPFNPLKDPKIMEDCLKNDWGIQFSHTIEEQVGGQLRAGFTLTDLYSDTNGEGHLHQLNIPTFYASLSIK